MQLQRWLLFILLCVVGSALAAGGGAVHKVAIDLTDQAALQRGARLYMNYCATCHSIKYLRYNRLAQDLAIVDDAGQIDKELLTNNLIFTTAKVSEPVAVAMPAEDAREWFGVVPPDLSLIGRVRGANWLYTYLTSFYSDPSQPFGANNLLYPDVAMPHVLANLQGKQIPIYRQEMTVNGDQESGSQIINELLLIQPGTMNQHEFNSAVRDLVTFLVYVAEPNQLQRQQIGKWVLAFLLLLLIVTYCLKKVYWKKIT